MSMQDQILALMIVITALALLSAYLARRSTQFIAYSIISVMTILTFVVRPVMVDTYNVGLSFANFSEDSVFHVLSFVASFQLITLLIQPLFARPRFVLGSQSLRQDVRGAGLFIIAGTLVLVGTHTCVAFSVGGGLVTTVLGVSLVTFAIYCWRLKRIPTLPRLLLILMCAASLALAGRTYAVLLLLFVFIEVRSVRHSWRSIVKIGLIVPSAVIVLVFLDSNREFSNTLELNIPEIEDLLQLAAILSYSFCFFDGFVALVDAAARPTFGMDVLRGALVLLPRSVFSWKPAVYGTEAEITQMVIGQVDSTFTPSFFGATYYWFGDLAIFIGPVLMCLSIYMFRRVVTVYRSRSLRYALLVLITFRFFRNGYDWIYTYAALVFAPALLSEWSIHWVAKSRGRRMHRLTLLSREASNMPSIVAR